MLRKASICLITVFASAAFASAAFAHPPTVDATHSSQYVAGGLPAAATDLGARHGQDCNEKEYHRDTWDCITEYYLQRPNGNRIFLAFGSVAWTGTYVNPYGPGRFGPSQALLQAELVGPRLRTATGRAA